MTCSMSGSLSSMNLNYFQELCSIFPNTDPMIIKAIIIHFKDWDKIISALLNPDQPDVQDVIKKSIDFNHSKSEDPKKSKSIFNADQSMDSLMQKQMNFHRSSGNVGINPNPTSYANRPQNSGSSQQGQLFLPTSIIDLPMDFDHFGNF